MIIRREKVLKMLLWLLLAATLCFIWGNSAETPDASRAKSEQVTSILTQLFDSPLLSHRLVRKLAHLIEYAVLGMELALLSASYISFSAQSAANCMFAALLTALADETIQICSNRGPLVSDVVLDFAAATFGILLVFLIQRIRKAREPSPASGSLER